MELLYVRNKTKALLFYLKCFRDFFKNVFRQYFYTRNQYFLLCLSFT